MYINRKLYITPINGKQKSLAIKKVIIKINTWKQSNYYALAGHRCWRRCPEWTLALCWKSWFGNAGAVLQFLHHPTETCSILWVDKGFFFSMIRCYLIPCPHATPSLSPVPAPHKMGESALSSPLVGVFILLKGQCYPSYRWWVTLTEGLGVAGRSHHP